MPWYIARLIIECSVLAPDVEVLCDEQFKIIFAANSEEAYERALKYGNEEDHDYENKNGDLVKWSFVGLSDLDELLVDTLESGVEVCSLLHRGIKGNDLICPKEKLAAFYKDSVGDTPVGLLLSHRAIPYAPK
jgi:hypothetical protein